MRGTEELAVICLPLVTGPSGIAIGYLLGAILRMFWVMCNFVLTGAVASLVPAEDPLRIFVARVCGGVGFFGVFIGVMILYITDEIRPEEPLPTSEANNV